MQNEETKVQNCRAANKCTDAVFLNLCITAKYMRSVAIRSTDVSIKKT